MLTFPSTVTLSHEGAETRTSKLAVPDARGVGLGLSLGFTVGLALGLSLEFTLGFSLGLGLAAVLGAVSAASPAALADATTPGLLEGSALALCRARRVASL
jgi:hypothetical protein